MGDVRSEVLKLPSSSTFFLFYRFLMLSMHVVNIRIEQRINIFVTCYNYEGFVNYITVFVLIIIKLWALYIVILRSSIVNDQGSKRTTFSWPGTVQSGPGIREARWARLNFSSARRFSRPARPGPGTKDIFICKDFFPVEFGDQFGITINILGNN
jgi:hypothetical protein